MSLLERLSQPAVWESFYEYKTSLALLRRDAERLRRFIDEKGYLPVCESIRAGGRFPLPEKSVISKLSSQKKRVVYTYPEAENRVLKLLTYLMLRKYDGAFPSGLYSFRPGRTAKDALTGLLRLPVQRMYSYKADVSNYFNSIEIPRLLPMLRETLEDDPELYRFLAALLSEPEALENGLPVVEQKGIMAGTPIASFFANLFLADLDRHFERAGVPYRRYSDDIILFGSTPEETAQHAAFVRDFLAENGLFLNPAKECFSSPEEGFTFLGFMVRGDTVDVAPVSVQKLKAKMRRKTRALARWRDKNGLEGEKAAKAFIRVFNRKLFENPQDSELTWTYWFFPVINTAASLNEIDRYAQECVRYLISGARTKARFTVRYERMKALGLKNLVHAYYDFSEEEQARRNRGRKPSTPPAESTCESRPE